MVWQRIRMALLVGALAAVAHPARAAEEPAGKIEPKPAVTTPAPQAMCTVRTWECVPETYQCTVTRYRQEYRDETCTTYKCECRPETRTRCVTTYQRVCEVKNVTCCVPCWEEKTVMKPCYTYKQVTKMVSKCVDQGHYECREVPCHSFRHKLKRHHKKDCCDPCCREECVPTKTVKVWCPKKVWIQCPVTCCEKVCEMKPVCCKVKTYKTEVKQVSCWKCVPITKQETYTCNVYHKVPCTTTRKVCVCVPYTECVTKTRMVRKCVEKQVACAPVCQEACAPTTCCETKCCKVKKCRHHRHAGLHHRCSSCCD